MIRRVHEARESLGGPLAVTCLANYDMALARLACAGVDVWLNTPLPPLEASGTSGMKAALNGVPSLGVLDGWWIEGHIEGVTGWAIGEPLGTAPEAPARAAGIDAHHGAALYDKLATSVLRDRVGHSDRASPRDRPDRHGSGVARPGRDGAGQPARRSRSIRSSIGGWVMNSRISPRRVAPEMPKAAIWSGKGSRP